MKINKVTGKAFHLPGDDIDTDRIIPARFIDCVEPEHFAALGLRVFEDDRKQRNGDHPFDQPDNKGCEILIADVNFGCGSSREHAVTAIERWGIKAIIARSFAAIFRGNSTANGLVCVDVSAEYHKFIVDALRRGHTEFFLDIENMDIQYRLGSECEWVPGLKCTMPSADRDMLTTGTWDTTATLLAAGDQIEVTAAKLPYIQIARLFQN